MVCLIQFVTKSIFGCSLLSWILQCFIFVLQILLSQMNIKSFLYLLLLYQIDISIIYNEWWITYFPMNYSDNQNDSLNTMGRNSLTLMQKAHFRLVLFLVSSFITRKVWGYVGGPNRMDQKLQTECKKLFTFL